MSAPATGLVRAWGLSSGALWHAGSGMSVSSDYKVSPAAFNLTDDLEPIQPPARPYAAVDDARYAHLLCPLEEIKCLPGVPAVPLPPTPNGKTITRGVFEQVAGGQ